jgi:hypothetical protein
MSTLRRTIERKAAKRAAKAVARHSAHGVVAKVERKPVRSAKLLTIGAALGAAAAWAAGRRSH